MAPRILKNVPYQFLYIKVFSILQVYIIITNFVYSHHMGGELKRITYLFGDTTSKQNLLSPSTTGLTVQSLKSSSIIVTSSPERKAKVHSSSN